MTLFSSPGNTVPHGAVTGEIVDKADSDDPLGDL